MLWDTQDGVHILLAWYSTSLRSGHLLEMVAPDCDPKIRRWMQEDQKPQASVGYMRNWSPKPKPNQNSTKDCLYDSQGSQAFWSQKLAMAPIS